ncbi:hypothetical protein D3C85_1381400 [compost metagenome]
MRSPQFQGHGGTGVAGVFRQARYARVAQGADDLVVGGQAGAGNAFGDHVRIAQDRRAVQQRLAPGPAGAFGELQAIDGVDHATGVDHAHGELFEVCGDPLESGFLADDPEGIAIDLLTIADVVNHQGAPSAGRAWRLLHSR